MTQDLKLLFVDHDVRDLNPSAQSKWKTTGGSCCSMPQGDYLNGYTISAVILMSPYK